MPALDAAWRPLFVGLTIFGAVFAFVGLLLGARAGGVGGALGGFFGGAIVGALFGAFTAIDSSLQVGIAIGVTLTLAAWPALAGLALRGYDWEELQRRFTPQASIDAAMATKAFIEARLPGGKEDGACFDEIQKVVGGGEVSTTALRGSTEEEQFAGKATG